MGLAVPKPLPTRYRVVVLTSSQLLNIHHHCRSCSQKETRRIEYSIRLVLQIVFV
jgi:hypothetical protein